MKNNINGAALSRSTFITSLKLAAETEIALILPDADINTQRKYRACVGKHITDTVTPLVWMEAKTSPASQAAITEAVRAFVRITIDRDRTFTELASIVGDGRDLDFVDFLVDAHTLACEDPTPEGIAKAADTFCGTIREVADVAIDLAFRAARGDKGRLHGAKIYAGRVNAALDDIRDVFIKAMEAENIDELEDDLDYLEFAIKGSLDTKGYGVAALIKAPLLPNAYEVAPE